MVGTVGVVNPGGVVIKPAGGVSRPAVGGVGIPGGGIAEPGGEGPAHGQLDMSAITLQSLGNVHAFVIFISLGLTVTNTSQ